MRTVSRPRASRPSTRWARSPSRPTASAAARPPPFLRCTTRAAALDEDAVFAASDTFQLTVTPVQDADSLNDAFTLRLRSTEAIVTGSAFRGTVIDDDPLANGDIQPHGPQGVRGEHDGAARPRRRARRARSFPTQLANATRTSVLTVTPAAARWTLQILPHGGRTRLCVAHLVGDREADAWSPAGRAHHRQATSPITSGRRRTCGSRRAATCRTFRDSTVTLALDGIVAADAGWQNCGRTAGGDSGPERRSGPDRRPATPTIVVDEGA